VVWADTEAVVRQWSRDQLTGLSRRVFFGVPDNPQLPLVTVARVGGGPEDSGVPFDQARISWQVWAHSKQEAASLTSVLTDRLDDRKRDG
jgi:hypothetical protein